ncbi:MAG: heavy metal translocating P-type ATPase, partial [Bacillota bacterium]|nr:heavy metal translocating P-type ATPase [Bacillota bacterium]
MAECATAACPACERCADPEAAQVRRQLAAIALAAALFALGLLFRPRLEATPFALGEYLVFLPAYFLVGGKVVRSALRNVLHGRLFDENFLMAVATGGAIALRELPEA